MVIGINPGHTKKNGGSPGASGILDESTVNREVANAVMALLKQNHVEVVDCSVDTASSSNDCLNQINSIQNAQPLDIFLSIHFNAYNKSAQGTEIYVRLGTDIAKDATEAQAIIDNIAALGFSKHISKPVPRGLSVLSNSKATKAMLLEVCFVDSEHDANLYESLKENGEPLKIASAIVKGLLGGAAQTTKKVIKVPYKTYKNNITYRARVDTDIYRQCPPNDGNGRRTPFHSPKKLTEGSNVTIEEVSGHFGRYSTNWVDLDYLEPSEIESDELREGQQIIYKDIDTEDRIQTTSPTLDQTFDWNSEGRPSVVTNEAPLFQSNTLEMPDNAWAGGDLIKKVHDKVLSSGAGYLIFFDNILMNPYITSWNSQLSNDGRICTASFNMLYLPPFHKTDVRDENGKLFRSRDGIQNCTNVRIFVMNVFTRKFDIVFDGDLRLKTKTKTMNGPSLSFQAVSHIDWLNRIVVPVSIPFYSTISLGDKLKWLGQGINLDSVSKIEFAQEAFFKGKTLQEFLGQLIEKTFKNNYLFVDENTVGYFDDAVNRIALMGDINPDLVKAQIMDFAINCNTQYINSMHTTLNQITTLLLCECYSDRDGLIRIKPPFWNQPVLKDHIIDPMLIISEQETTDYQDFYTRIIASGGNEEWQQTQTSAMMADFLTPVGVYVGNTMDSTKAFWADYTGVTVKFKIEGGGEWVSGLSSFAKNDPAKTRSEKRTTSTWLDAHYEIYKDFGVCENRKYHTGIDYKLGHTPGTKDSIYSNSVFALKNCKVKSVSIPNPNFRTVGHGRIYFVDLVLEITDETGSNSTGEQLIYEHLGRLNDDAKRKFKIGTLIKQGENIGVCGLYNDIRCFHLAYKNSAGKFCDPVAYLNGELDQETTRPDTAVESTENADSSNNPDSDANKDADSDTIVSAANYDQLAELLRPSDDERKYGPNFYTVNQPLIRFQTSGAIEKAATPAEALRNYSQFLYYMLNANVDTCEVEVIAMPWLRPGFNVWLDPTDTDKVYYLNSISYSGSASSGVTSQLSLSLGRVRESFINEPTAFGAQKETNDNVLMSTFFNSQKVNAFGTVLNSDDYDNIRGAALNYYQTDTTIEDSPEYSAYFKNLYGSVNHSPGALALFDQSYLDPSETPLGEDRIDVSESDLTAFNSVTRPTGLTFMWPVEAYTIANGSDTSHPAIDIACTSGNNIVAMADGYVCDITSDEMGQQIRIRTSLDEEYEIYEFHNLIDIKSSLTAGYNQVTEKMSAENKTFEEVCAMDTSTTDKYNYTYGKYIRVTKGEIIGTTNVILHVAVGKGNTSGTIEYDPNPLAKIARPQGVGGTYVDIEYDSHAGENAFGLTVDSIGSTSFCQSDKFFAEEMTYDEIQKRLDAAYTSDSTPAVIRNRAIDLKARCDEADRFIQLYYTSYNFAKWQDIKSLTELVNTENNTGVLTGEWVDDLYVGTTPDELFLPSIGDFSHNRDSGGSGDGGVSVQTGTTEQIEIIIATAKKYIGVPYVYGGSTPAGFDCSGLTQYCYNAAGIKIERNSAAQYATAPIKISSIDELQRGDLMFFDTKGKNDKQVSHVGIYLGDGTMIHAPRTGDHIRIVEIDDHRKAQWVGGGRWITIPSGSGSMDTNIMGSAIYTADQLYQLFQKRDTKKKTDPKYKSYPQIYLDEGRKEGVRGDLAYVQALEETNNWNFDGDVKENQNNFGGLGATGGGEPGESFSSPEIGIRAQIQHLKAYASTEPLNGQCVDNRFGDVKRGSAPKLEDLQGKWAMDSQYASKLLSILSQLASIAGTNTQSASSSSSPGEPSSRVPSLAGSFGDSSWQKGEFLGDFLLTAYCPCKNCSGPYGTNTASGAKATAGKTIAVDKNIIPLGTIVYIEGVGWRQAQDTGSGVKGKHIDVYVNNHFDCYKAEFNTNTLYNRKVWKKK